MDKRLIIRLILASCLAVSLPAFAKDSDDKENEHNVERIEVTGQLSTFGATKSNIPIMETARSISIETEQAFRDKGALTLDDTLNYTSGVVGDTFGFSTRGDFPTVRGLDIPEYRDNLQVLFGFYNNTRTDVYMLEQVEILKGPASVLFGKGSPGGIVNAISKLAGPDLESEIALDIGTHDRYQASFDINHELTNNLFFRVVGVYRDSETQVDFVKDDAAIIMPSITFENDRTTLTAMFEYADREGDTAHQFLPRTGTQLPSATGQTIEPSTYLGDPNFNRFNTESVTFSVLGSHEITDSFSIEGIARYKDGESDYRQSWVSFLGDGVPRIDAMGNGLRSWFASERSSEQFAIDLRARFNFSTGQLEHEVIGGVNFQDVTTGQNRAFTRSGFINVFNPVYGNIPALFTSGTPLPPMTETTTEDLGFYISDQITYGNWYLNLGVRHDQVDTESSGATQDDDATSFSAGLLYEFDMGISPYISYAESFEPVLGRNAITGDFFKPQEGEQTEVGIKYQPPGTSTYITFAYFDIEQSNLASPGAIIAFDPSLQQEGVAEIDGFEIEAHTNIGDVYLEANFSSIDTQNPEGFPLSTVPEQLASAWAQYQPSGGTFYGFKVGAGVRYASDNEDNSSGIKVETDGYVVGDLMIGYEINNWDFTLNIRNITDEEYFGTCLVRGDCFPGEERTAVLRIAKRF